MTYAKIYRLLKLALVVSALIAAWLFSFRLAATGFSAISPIRAPLDLSIILLGAAAISLFIFSLMVTVLAIYVWYSIENKLRVAVREENKGQLESLGNELRGKAHAMLGYIIGELSVDDAYLKPTDAERLREAIYYCEQAYSLLKDSGLPSEYMVLNNLIQYSCIAGHTTRRRYLLESARKLRVAAEEHDSLNLLLTYAKAIFTFGSEPGELSEAYQVVQEILSANSEPRITDLNEKQLREAEQLASLFEDRGIKAAPVLTFKSPRDLRQR